jgi:16S rRNA (cytosine967-C5)-methyltransferase
MRPGALEQRMKDQDEVLERAVGLVKKGGRIVYVTCSLLREENQDRVSAFVERHPQFKPRDMRAVAKECGLGDMPARFDDGPGMTLTPATTGTDGFFVCVLTRD